MNPIRHLEGSLTTNDVLAVTARWVAHLRCAEEVKVVRLYPAFDETDHRVAMEASLDLCVIGSWFEGIKAYRLSDGALLWEKRDSLECNDVAIDPLRRLVLIRSEQISGCLKLEASTGRVSGIDRAAVWIFPHPQRRIMVTMEVGPKYFLESEGGEGKQGIDLDAFGILSISYGKNSFLISTSEGGLKSFDLKSGRLLGELFDKKLMFHVVPTGFSKELSCYLGVFSEFKGSKNSSLVRLSEDLFQIEPLAEFPYAASCAFFADAQRLLTSEGELRDTPTGRCRKAFDWSRVLNAD